MRPAIMAPDDSNGRTGADDPVHCNGPMMTFEAGTVREASDCQSHRAPQRSLTPFNLCLGLNANDYTAQKDQGFRFRTDRDPWPLKLPLDWRADERDDKNFNIQLHFWRMIDPIMREWFVHPSSPLIGEMFQFARDWHRFHRHEACANSWNDMAAGYRALRIAFFMERDRLDPGVFTDADRHVIADLFRSHSDYLMNPANWSVTNHGLFQALGNRIMHQQAGELAANIPFVEASGQHMRKCLHNLFTDEGIQTEHSAGYHFFVTDAIRRCAIREVFPELGDVVRIIDLAEQNRAWLYFPDGMVSRVGDTRSLNDVTSFEVPDVQGGQRWQFGDRSLDIGDFSRSGWTVVKSAAGTALERQCMLFFTAMNHGIAHKHADDLSFELFENGRHVLVDSGQYAYSPNDEMKRYVTSAAAHNTVDLGDGPRDETAAYGSGLNPVRTSKRAVVLSGEVLGRAGKFDHHRRLRYRPGLDLEICDVLDVAGRTPLELCSRLHFARGLDVRKEADGFSIRLHDKVVARVSPPGGWSTESIFGRADPPLGWVTIGYKIMRPIWVIEARRTVSKTVARWRLTFPH
jgi:hypothetical protein